MKKQEAQKQINILRDKLSKWAKAYYVFDAPLVEDSLYDETYNELKRLEELFPELKTDDSQTSIVASGSKSLESSTFEKTKHEINMLSLDNVFNNDGLIDFDNKIKKESTNYSYYVEPKIDGLSISLIYKNGSLQKALTRGDGNIGEDVTNNALQVKDIPHNISYQKDITIRGEIFIDDDTFELINKRREANGESLFANPRNAASGTMRQLDPGVVAERNLKMIAYWAMEDADTYPFPTQEQTIISLDELGFNTSKLSRHAENIEQVISAVELIDKNRSTIGYETDGVVIKVNENELYEEIGYTTKFPKWAIAFKFPEEVKETKLLEIFPTIGRTGRVTYNAKLEPVELSGTIVQRATLHNSDYVRDLDLRIGDVVRVKKAGEIIPKVVSANKEKRNSELTVWIEDKHCPKCNTPLFRYDGEVDQYCTNEECPSRLAESIIHFVSRNAMNIDGFSTKQIEKFINLGWIKKFSDIYKLKDRVDEILNLEGYQIKSVNSLINSIEESKLMPLDKFLFGLGIRHVGAKTAKDLARTYFSIDNISKITYNQLMENNDFGEVKSKSIVEYFKSEKHLKELNELKELGINPTFDEIKINKDSFLFGKKVVVTGTIPNLKRNEVKDYLEKFGAKITTSLSNATDFLIVGEKPSPNKVAKMPEDKIIKFEDLEQI